MSRAASIPTRWALAGILAFALVAVACGGSDSPTGPLGNSVAEVEAQSFSLLNQARSASAGLPMLAFDEQIAAIARTHSEAMRDQGFFGHVNSEGKGLRARLREAGLQYSTAGENLAQVRNAADPAGLAHQQLMGSPSHRDNILGSKFRRVGVGVAHAGDAYWITQIFIEP